MVSAAECRGYERVVVVEKVFPVELAEIEQMLMDPEREVPQP